MELGKNSESKRFTGAAIAGIAAISLGGCGSEAPEPDVTYNESVSVTYNDDGTRWIDHGEDYPRVYQYCEAGYLNSVTANGDGYEESSGGFEIDLHPACEDGKLTPEDFLHE